MNKFIFCFITIVFTSVNMFAQTPDGQYTVQVAAFDTPAPSFYFFNLGSIKTFLRVDPRGVYHYNTQKFTKKAEAEAMLQKVQDAGFKFARIVDELGDDMKCAASCEKGSDLVNLRHIFFDFDRADLRLDSKQQLERLQVLLRQHPEWSVELRAHTDSKGTDAYNNALSKRRADRSKNYLVGLGIAASRIRTAIFGESKPIAKNETTDGRDLEAGRQFNRRVEFYIIDGEGRDVGMVETIAIPVELR
ncbi:MAG: hypothetical protein RI894_1023 [Bacteroidota bacterium]|jgi:outer membrane protein OmpA-like peptidoglycan-associated protein